MHPQAELFTNIGNTTEIVDDAEIGGTARCDDGYQALRPVLGQRRSQRGASDPTRVIDRDRYNLGIHDARHLRNRAVRGNRRSNLEPPGWPHAVVLFEPALSGRDE